MNDLLTTTVPLWVVYLVIFATTIATRAWADTAAARKSRKAMPPRKLARDCATCRHVIYAEYCDCPELRRP